MSEELILHEGVTNVDINDLEDFGEPGDPNRMMLTSVVVTIRTGVYAYHIKWKGECTLRIPSIVFLNAKGSMSMELKYMFRTQADGLLLPANGTLRLVADPEKPKALGDGLFYIRRRLTDCLES